jgi:hypothetical protein
MKHRSKSVVVACGILTLAASLWGQKAKSKKEVEAINAINAATTVDDRVKAIENVLTNLPTPSSKWSFCRWRRNWSNRRATLR